MTTRAILKTGSATHDAKVEYIVEITGENEVYITVYDQDDHVVDEIPAVGIWMSTQNYFFASKGVKERCSDNPIVHEKTKPYHINT